MSGDFFLIWLLLGIIVGIILALEYYVEKEKEKKQKEREERIVAEIKKSDTRRGDNNIDVLRKLAELHKKGIITDEEFEQKKRELLDKL
ncbi:MAG: SHOCT domain-containing protein [candidate division WOR-3 bacterium]|nr:SHOCT domain-containing protein [candidate division WOR-3 bacterium]